MEGARKSWTRKVEKGDEVEGNDLKNVCQVVLTNLSWDVNCNSLDRFILMFVLTFFLRNGKQILKPFEINWRDFDF